MAKELELEVLDRLGEVEARAEAWQKSWKEELQGIKNQRALRFDVRTLMTFGAIALSITGYVLQDARNTARQDAEIDGTKARVARLEQIAATNTEGRVRTEVELGQLREGQVEIKRLIEAHDSSSKKALPAK